VEFINISKFLCICVTIHRGTVSDVLQNRDWGDSGTEGPQKLCISQHMTSDVHFSVAAVR
jgi:hypothetical protein